MSIEDAHNAIDISRCIDTPKNMSQLSLAALIRIDVESFCVTQLYV